jgi:hypothetical protein
MAAPVTPCDSCGSPIPDSDLETGNAITLLGKRYCAGCKGEAIQAVSLDDLAARPGAAPRPAPSKAAAAAPPKPAPKAAPRAPSPVPAPAKPPAPKAAPEPAPPRPERKPALTKAPEGRPAARRPAAPPAKPASRTPILIGAAAVVVVAAVAAFFLLRGDSTSPGEKGGGKGGAGGGTSTTAPVDREAQARDAYAKVVDLSQRAGSSWDLILAAADKAKPACRGTEWEKRLEELRARAAQEKETEDAAKDLAPLVDELKGAVATDPEFKRFVELQPKFQLALEMAGKTNSARMTEIRTLQREYNGKYEKLAEPYYNSINEEATQLAEEKRYDDALRRINGFPQHLRHSTSWLSLDKLRQDIERRKKDALPRK